MNPLEVLLAEVQRDERLRPNLCHHRVLPLQEAEYGDPNPDLPDWLQRAVQEQGITRLYSHQVEAVQAVRDGESVVAVTPTASGKSLLYNIPVIERLSREGGHALYIFPLKALEQDQAAKLNALLAKAPAEAKLTAGIYDGDTPAGRRRRMRENPPSILITNPDMLHLAIMSHHESWEDLLRGLKFVVLDELHIYRGVFGSHILHVLHRLVRLCNHYGAAPQFIATSATIAGAGELAQKLTGLPFRVMERSGAPQSERHFLFFNPTDSYLTLSLRLFAAALQSGLKVIAFTKARRTTELLHRWLNEAYPELAGAVSSYRAGFLPEERREIERALAGGALKGVISTSALELGIDIGGLDVCVLVGYPGTIAATWQRAGRVGRARLPAAVCLVAGQDQLDQYFMRFPDELFGRSVEQAVVDPENDHIARLHLLCAAQELPLRGDDPFWSRKSFDPLIRELAGEGLLLRNADGDRWFCALRRPQRRVNVRAAGDRFTILLEDDRTTLGSVSGRAVFAECHAGAVYLHRAEQFLVTELDLQNKRVIVRKVDLNYYTTPLFDKDTEIIDEQCSAELPAGRVTRARLKVTERLVGYQKRRYHTQELLSQHDLQFPPTSYETVGLVIAIPPGIADLADRGGLHFRGGIHGMEHALLALAPLFAICDRNDLGGYSQAHHPQVGGPAVFLYDGYPGGIGLCARLYEVFPELTVKTLDLVASCDCELGCPSCIQSPKCGHGNVPLDKGGTILALEVVSGRRKLASEPPTATDSKTGAVATGRQREPQTADTAQIQPAATESVTRKMKSEIRTPHIIQRLSPGFQGVVFDLETQRSADEVGGWGNIRAMGLAVGVVYRFPQDRWEDYWERDAGRLVEVLETADLVVGFNQVRFDYEVLRAYNGLDFRKVESYDILKEIERSLGYRLKLDSVATATLGVSKSADGLQSLEWWRRGEKEKVLEYCRHDVEVTRDLFYHILEKEYLLFEKRGLGLARIPMQLPQCLPNPGETEPAP